MKLNKVLALALSGVMAVSMLAGCSNNSGNGGQNGQEQEQTQTSAVVTAVNNGQNKDNKVKINFTADPTFDTALQTAASAAGEDANFDSVENKLKVVLGNDVVSMTESTAKSVLNTKKDGSNITAVEVYGIDGNYTETAAQKKFAEYVNTLVSKLKAAESGSIGDEVVKYSYTGNVSMVKVTNLNGTVEYFAAVMINATGAKAEVTV